MNLASILDRLHAQARQNRWLRYFAVFNRVALAAGFIPSGFVKIMGERFTSLSNNHPMGHYLEALHHTGYYYPFIGVLQVTAALLLLLPGTAVLGAVLYLPIILNICILSLAVRFDGSLLTSPLMVLANLYLLCWYYDRIKFLFPFTQPPAPAALPAQNSSNKFPTAFFAGVAATVALVVVGITSFDIKPYNTLADCRMQFKGGTRTQAGNRFCECIHNQGIPLDQAMAEYRQAPDDPASPPLPAVSTSVVR
ncbi:DoxX family protein [Hymenobacter busanensis]|uniref:DoxX family protein n=1 Tax=Hymenobacter busanensis TaxID=2607656 RepID=A0A7L4ZSQ1_9BACT|nr:DoxX family protein [Hymenobacter busanensis]KAA9327534.1 DoxX family protein [Hymenobacter busanensis]QHJ06128.1 DoxX family protein [Hymenobacter busanensis]